MNQRLNERLFEIQKKNLDYTEWIDSESFYAEGQLHCPSMFRKPHVK